MDDLHGMTNDDLHEALRPARGILYGAGVSILGWIALVCVLAACVGCNHTSSPNMTVDKKSDIVYFTDERTGVCFAAINSASADAYRITSIAAVECTPEVLALVNK